MKNLILVVLLMTLSFAYSQEKTQGKNKEKVLFQKPAPSMIGSRTDKTLLKPVPQKMMTPNPSMIVNTTNEKLLKKPGEKMATPTKEMLIETK